MFIGHYAPALVAAGSRRGPALAAMFVAAQFVDYAFFAFVLLGVERMRETSGWTVMNTGDFYHMPYTHSLLGTLGFAALWALVSRLRRHDWRRAWIGAAVVASHWLLDLLVHAPDLTLAGVGRRYGLALWNRPQVEMPLELGIVTLAFVFYLSRTRARTWRGRLAPAVLAATLVAVQLVDWLGTRATRVVDPVPASVPLTALLAYTILAALAGWTARERTPATGPTVSPL